MSVSLNDLKGFDFSDKYFHVHEKFSIKKDGKEVDFKIIKRKKFNGDEKDIYLIEYEYYTNIQLMKRSTYYKNPLEIFNEVEKDIVKSDNKLNTNAIQIENSLKEFFPDFDDWNELSYDLFSEVDILGLYPEYKSSKIPQDLSKENLAKYFDKFSKYELELLFKEISMLDFEILYQNTWGEDYEYYIKKAFSIEIFGEEYFDFKIFQEINKKRQEFYISSVLNKYGINSGDIDLFVPIIYSIINPEYESYKNRIKIDLDDIRFKRLVKKENIDLKKFDGENFDFKKFDEELSKISELKKRANKTNQPKYVPKKTDFNNLDDCLTKSKYVFVLKAISSTSTSPIVMRYKIPKENRKEDSIQTIALKNGHIKYGNSKDYLSEYTVNQLKGVLKKYGLKLDGNKIHLINRIKENLSDEIVNNEFPTKYFVLTEKGLEYLDTYYYLAEFYSVLPLNFTLEEFDLICKSNPEISPDEIIMCLVNEKWIIWDKKLGDEPQTIENNKKQLETLFENRKHEDNFFMNYFDELILP